MTSEQIRQNGITGYATMENRAIVDVLEEIAAQLAELNHHLKNGVVNVCNRHVLRVGD